MSPKGWAQAELPDMFLSNLFHQPGRDGLEDAYTDFSGSASTGSESGASPEAFQEFMLGSETQRELAPEWNNQAPPSMSPSAAELLPDWTQPLAGLSTAPMELKEEAHPLTAPLSLEAMSLHNPDFPISASSAPSGLVDGISPLLPSDEPDLAGIFLMQTGSNANALSALARLREFTKQTSERQQAADASHLAHAPGADGAEAGPEYDTQTKKVAHNAIERRYRSNINDRIAGLRDVVPALREMRPRTGARRRRTKNEAEPLIDGIAVATKVNKATVLSKATEYICYLKSREVQLDRQLKSLQMLVCSLEGGDELLAAWTAEMERIERIHPSTHAAYGRDARPTDLFLDADNELDSDNDLDTEPADSPEARPSKVAKRMLGVFAGFSFLGGAADWSGGNEGTLPQPPSHTRVLGAGHQLLKRSTDLWTSEHPYDHVPVHQLVFELVRTTALVVCVLAAVYGLFVHRQRTCAQRQRQRAHDVQKHWPMAALMASPFAYAWSTPPVAWASVQDQYAALATFLGVPTKRWALWFWALGQGLLCFFQMATAVSVQRVAAYWAGSDPTVTSMKKQACMRRLEMELALGARIQPSVLARLGTVWEYKRCLFGTPADDEETALLALADATLASVPVLGSYFVRAGEQRWNALRVSVHSAPQDTSTFAHALADLVRLPLADAAASIRRAVDADAVVASPLATILDTLRNEELLAFWTTLLASAMRRPSNGKVATLGVLQPHVLDVVADKPALLALRRQLHTVSRTRPVRTRLALEQLLTAQAFLAFVCGNIAGAKQVAARLAKHAPEGGRSHATEVLLGLVVGATAREAPIHGPVDAVASVVIGWLHLQKTWATTPAPSEATAARRVNMQRLASQCVWYTIDGPVAAPEKAAAPRRAVSGSHARRTTSSGTRSGHPALGRALDTLLDHLAGIPVCVQDTL